MYDFNLAKGDTLKIEFPNLMCDSLTPLIVDSTIYITLNNQKLKTIYLSTKWYSSKYKNTKSSYYYSEKIGNEREFIFSPSCSFSETFIVPFLRCYQEADFYYKSKYWSYYFPNLSCDTIINDQTNVEKVNSNPIFLKPNPTDGFVYLISNKKINSVTIFNIYGCELHLKINNQNQIDLSNYAKGVYFFKIQTSDFKIEVKKIMKN
jgi:hypothetical protein